MLSRTHFQENFQEHFNIEGHNGFLDYVSIILFDQTAPQTLKGKKIIRSKHLRS